MRPCLTDLEWMTGAFIELGSYRCFEEPENQLKNACVFI